jgi:hypothetical protein
MHDSTSHQIIWGAFLESGKEIIGSRAKAIVGAARALKENFDFVREWQVPGEYSDSEALIRAEVMQRDYEATLQLYGVLQ